MPTIRSSSSARLARGLALHLAVELEDLGDLVARRPRPGSATTSAAGRSSRSGRRGSGASRRRDSFSRSWPSNRTSPASIRPGLRDEPHDRQARHALAAARLADEPHDLAAVDVEVDAVDRPDDAVAGVERRAQAADLEQRPSPRSLAARRARAGTSSSMTVSSRLGPSVPLSERSVGVDHRRRSSVEPRVERVAQAVAEQVERRAR